MLENIVLTIGRTGKMTPNAVMTDVVLSGTIVSAASLCNADEVERLGVNIGDEVFVEKSAEIIPKVMGVAKKHSKGVWQMPKSCPSCHHDLIRPENFVDYFCPNRECEAQVFKRLKHATSKAALDIDGCGDVTIKELMKHGVKALSDLFSIDDLSFMKQAARRKLEEGREKAKVAALWRKIHALGFEGIGSTKSKELAAKWPSLHAMLDDMDALNTVLGDETFKNFMSYLDDTADEIDRLNMLGFRLEAERMSQGPLTGKFFVVTGQLVTASRTEISAKIEECGGTVKSTVGKNVNYLVVAEGAGNKKQDDARKHGTVVITEEQLYQLMGKPMPLMTEAEALAEREY